MTKLEFFKDEFISLRFEGNYSCITPGWVPNHQPKTIGSFGLFGDSPDFNKFYPDLNVDNLEPLEEDFIYPVYRLLSEVIVTKYGVPIDFSNPGVLKNSLEKLKGITVYPDHNFDSVANSLGVVFSPFWQESYTVDGVKVPAGINGVLKLDAKSNPRIARLISMDPPAIHSSSVTVKFKRKKSHPQMEDSEFLEKAGSFDEKGELVRFIVEDISLFYELSLVSHGADPFAQKIGSSGTIVNPGFAKSNYSFSASDDNSVNIDFRQLKELSLSVNHKTKFKMEFKQILESLGLSSDQFKTPEDLKTHFESLVSDHVRLNELIEETPEITVDFLKNLQDNQIPEGRELLPENAELISDDQKTLLTQIEDLGGIASLKSSVSLADTYLNLVRTSAVSTYRLIYGDSIDPQIIALMEKADINAAKAFEAQYTSLLEEKIPLLCQSCGSGDVSRASHKKDPKKSLHDKYQETNVKLAKAARRKPSSMHF